jgi:hypothetical protein
MKLTISASHFLILRIDYMVTKCLPIHFLSQRVEFSSQNRFITGD